MTELEVLVDQEQELAITPSLVDRTQMEAAVQYCSRPHANNPQKELAARNLARRHLLDYTTYTYPAYRPEPAHWLIADVLTRVLSGDIQKLMVFAPPQHGKSELVSRRFPIFWLAHRPNDPVIITSYGASLAGQMASDAKDILEGPLHHILFPKIETDPGTRGKYSYRIHRYRGSVEAAGVGGPITGHGAGLGIIDDPIKNYEQAMSSGWRQKVWDWYRTTFRTRVWEEGSVAIVMTRWHEDDLAGRLLGDQPGEWTVLRIPAWGEEQEERDTKNRRMHLPLGEPDPLSRAIHEPMAPLRYSYEALATLRRDVGLYGWEAEYMGSPTAPEGNTFKREWFTRFVDVAPVEGLRVRYWDKGGSEGRAGSWTSGVLLCYHEGIVYVEDSVRGKWEAPARERVIRQTAEGDRERYTQKHEPLIYVEQEPGSGGKESAQATVRNLAGYKIRIDRPGLHKSIRWEPFAVQAEAGNVRIVKGRWNWSWLDEMVAAVPDSGVNDQADSTAGGFNMVIPRARAKVRSLGGIEE